MGLENRGARQRPHNGAHLADLADLAGLAHFKTFVERETMSGTSAPSANAAPISRASAGGEMFRQRQKEKVRNEHRQIEQTEVEGLGEGKRRFTDGPVT